MFSKYLVAFVIALFGVFAAVSALPAPERPHHGGDGGGHYNHGGDHGGDGHYNRYRPSNPYKYNHRRPNYHRG